MITLLFWIFVIFVAIILVIGAVVGAFAQKVTTDEEIETKLKREQGVGKSNMALIFIGWLIFLALLVLIFKN